MNDITSFKTLVGTLYKKLNKASTYGTLNFKTLLLLDIVNEYLYDCPTCYNNNVIKKLRDLSIQLQHQDKEICIYREQKSIYTNILGCKDCNPNNSSIQVINTPPVITDPEPIEPPVLLPPRICENAKSIPFSLRNKSRVITKEEMTGCFIDSQGGTIRYLKIVSLPLKGALMYNNLSVELGQIIDFDLNIDLIYNTILLNSLQDQYQYQVAGSSAPTLYNDEIVTMIINYI